MPPAVQIVPATLHHTASAVLDTPKLPDGLLPLLETNCFEMQSWHLPYAQALIEEALPFLPIAITLAERAILTRYFELHQIAAPLDERRDLWRAVEELRKLRKKLAKS